MSDQFENPPAAHTEAPRLLSSNAVDGIPIFGRDGDRLGTIAAFMIDRFTGRVDYVVVAMGRVLGLGGSFHPLPWSAVAYEPRLEGYMLGVERSLLSSGPSFKSPSDAVFDAAYSERISTYYGAPLPRRD